MAFFANVQRQLPDVWIMRKGPVTARETMYRYGMKTEQLAETMLNNMVRDGRLVQFVDGDGIPKWRLRR